jgi:DNA polymerase III sliding clamp (beta) subunit (PCNA family)
MRLSIERAALLKALGHVQNVVERRNTIPILSNVLLSADGADLTLVATDLDIEVSEGAQADVSAPGQPANCLTARRLSCKSTQMSALMSMLAARISHCRFYRRATFPK